MVRTLKCGHLVKDNDDGDDNDNDNGNDNNNDNESDEIDYFCSLEAVQVTCLYV